MKKSNAIIGVLFLFITSCVGPKSDQQNIKTNCNPVDLSYRFQLDGASRREAADPAMVLFKDDYYLFASKSGGYWYSSDLANWKFVTTQEIPVEDYAPGTVVLNDTIYFMASNSVNTPIYKSGNPKSGKWQLVCSDFPIPATDPAFFLNDDGRLYFYWGCSNQQPIFGIELDVKTFEPIGKPDSLLFANTEQNGWENPGDYNELKGQSPWIEGAWVNKINGKYYLQYAGPGTEYKSYSDGVYTSDNPLGPFTLAAHNPFAYKPEGFACGTGHGSTFTDKYGNYWHIGTVTISQKHVFERRLALYPVFVDADSTLYSVTRFGDYPYKMPNKKIESLDEIFAGWMLLSFNKNVTVSSTVDSLLNSSITDENIRTYWAAKTGSAGEWVMVDLAGNYDIYALQLNFAEHNTQIFGRKEGISHKYLVEYSIDANNWELLIDQSKNQTDNSHCYHQLNQKIVGRYLRIKNIEVPDGNFALSGFRVFGLGKGQKPEPVEQLIAERNPNDRSSITLSWQKMNGVIGYNILYGNSENTLYHTYQVYTDTSVTINSLSTVQPYYFTIESFNENGTTKSKQVNYIE